MRRHPNEGATMKPRESNLRGVHTIGLLVVAMLCASPLVSADPVRIALDTGPVVILRHLTHLLRPSTAPDNRVCSAGSGDTGMVLETVASEISDVYWVRVRFDSGACNGKDGWVASDAIRTP